VDKHAHMYRHIDKEQKYMYMYSLYVCVCISNMAFALILSFIFIWFISQPTVKFWNSSGSLSLSLSDAYRDCLHTHTHITHLFYLLCL